MFILAGFVFAHAQNVITTTTTSVITIQPTTYTTEITISGTTIIATVEFPGYTLIAEIREQDRTCTITFTATQPPNTIAVPGTTIAIPGTTWSTVINEATVVTTVTVVEGGTTFTRTGIEPITLPNIPFPIPAYGVIREVCAIVTDTEIYTYIIETAPATVRIAFQGFTTAFQGTTITIEQGGDFPTINTILTYTTVRPGTTDRYTQTQRGYTSTESRIVTPTTVRTTVVREGTTITEVITTVITVGSPTDTGPRTTQATTSPAQTTQPQTTPAQTTPTQTAPSQGPEFNILTIATIAAFGIIVVVAVFIFLRMR